MGVTTSQRGPMSVRPAAVAGMFYPANAAELNSNLDDYLSNETTATSSPKAIIAPHAGYIYSGPVAGSVYSNVAQLRDVIKRVVLLGPAHRVYVDGIAIPTATHFATPLGNVELDSATLNKLSNLSFIEYMDIAHSQEHSLEVHIPFLQKVLDDFVLIPLLVGNASAEEVAAVLESLWGDAETLIVVSSDLSHYHQYQDAKDIDADTTRLIEAMDYQHIGPEQACGCMPMRGLLKLAKQKNMQLHTLDLRNSGDTAGPRDRVVGYGAYALYEDGILDDKGKECVFTVMKRSIEQGLSNGSPYKPDISEYDQSLTQRYAVFVTLELDNQLRGCIGTTEAQMPLIEAVAHFAHAAAFSDPRFPALTTDEYQKTSISLSILTSPTVLEFDDETHLIAQLRPGIDGLIIEKGRHRATFLPVVWESLPQPTQFISHLKQKAGIRQDETPEKAWRYTAEYYTQD